MNLYAPTHLLIVFRPENKEESLALVRHDILADLEAPLREASEESSLSGVATSFPLVSLAKLITLALLRPLVPSPIIAIAKLVAIGMISGFIDRGSIVLGAYVIPPQGSFFNEQEQDRPLTERLAISLPLILAPRGSMTRPCDERPFGRMSDTQERRRSSVYTRHLIEVDPQRIKFNPLNPRKHRGTEYIRLQASIRAIGIVQPPIVRILPGGFYEVIDGEGRVSIAQEEHFEKIWVVSVGIIDEHDALVMLQASNTLRSFNLLAECKGLANLHRQGMEIKDLAKQFGSSDSKVTTMVAIGYFPAQTLARIEEHIAIAEKQAEVWTYTLLLQILPLRGMVPGTSSETAGGSPDGHYDYQEVDAAVEKVIRGEITGVEQMRVYVVNRRYEIYQERFDQDLHRRLEEELARLKQELETVKAQEVQQIEEQAREEYADQIAILQRQLDELNKRHTAIVKEVARRPEIVARREQELREQIQQAEAERQQLRDTRRTLQEQAERMKAQQEEEARSRRKQWEEEARQALERALAEQRESQARTLQQIEEDLKTAYAQKEQDLQIKAENTIRGLLSHGIKSLTEAQQVLEHIISASMIQHVQQLGGTQQDSLLVVIRSMSDVLERAERKLARRDLVVQVEGGIVNGHRG